MTRIGNGPAEGLVEPIKEGFVFDMMGGGGLFGRKTGYMTTKMYTVEYNQSESV